MNFHPLVTHHFEDVEAVEALHVTILGYPGQKEFPLKDDIKSQGLQRKTINKRKR